ncbi:MAG: hypothetical protein ACJAR9_001156 [Celeribacter sp.]|jgi:hypothetical protein
MPYHLRSVKGFSDFAAFWVWSVCFQADTLIGKAPYGV